jgi:chromosome partitioning protein
MISVGSTKTISFVNQKGGVGKTTSTHAIGACLAEMGDRVLLVDLDPQASLTISVGFDQNRLQGTIDSLFQEILDGEEPNTPSAVTPLRSGLDIIPSRSRLRTIEFQLNGALSREFKLRSILGVVSSVYDWILIDCPAALGNLTINAMVASNFCVIPIVPEPLVTASTNGILRVTARIQRDGINPNLAILGVILTRVEPRLATMQALIAELYNDMQDLILGEIRDSVTIQNALTHGVLLTEYRPAARAMEGYRRVAEVINERCQGWNAAKTGC